MCIDQLTFAPRVSTPPHAHSTDNLALEYNIAEISDHITIPIGTYRIAQQYRKKRGS